MSAYYNENDLKTAAWLRQLVKAGLIADGEVDTRSIVDVQPGDLRGFQQCHFFAGIGGWSYALRLAGWADDRECWTGSCPCQPWSSAGKGLEADDPRDLWPTWFKLISECGPCVVFGEQVAGKAGRAWLDRVYDDMEASGYALGPVDLPACSVGAFHKRQRLWFVGDTVSAGLEERSGVGGLQPEAVGASTREAIERASGSAGGMADANGGQSSDRDVQRSGRHDEQPEDTPTGFWDAVEWLACTDGKLRPVEPGTFPLAYGIPARILRLRGYGNSINPWVAAEVIAAYMEIVNADI